MKPQLDFLKALAGRVGKKTHGMLLAPAMLIGSSAFAASTGGLPTMPAPGPGIGGTTPAAGDWLGTMGAWIKSGITIFALVAVAMGFMYVVMGALGKWRAYSMGRAEMSDLKEYIIMGSVLAIFLVVIASYAISTLA